jgi:heat shock protein HtpX
MYTQIDANKRKTLLLLAGFVGFMLLAGWVLGRATSSPGMITVIGAVAVVYALISYFAAAKIALALAGAQPVVKRDAPELYRVVENLSIAGGLPMPRVYIIHDPAPNALATGRDPGHAVVAVTTGLLDMMTESELEGVIAHELSHVGNYDIRLMAVVIMLVTIITTASNLFLRLTFWGSDDEEGGGNAIMLALGLILALISPLVATIMQLAVSRKREYLADASGALLTRYPEGLASALKKIAADPRTMRQASTATAHLFIANPLKAKGLGGTIANLFSTHPPLADRIAKLEHMELTA